MAMDKDEIDRYVFDPENPRNCKYYKRLLASAKKDAYWLFSTDFFLYLIDTLDIFKKDFEDELEIDDYDITDFTIDDFEDIDKNKYIEEFKKKYYFIKNIANFMITHIENDIWFNLKNPLEKYLEDIGKKQECLSKTTAQDYKKICIIFSNCIEFAQFHITKSSVFITLEENRDEFYEKERVKNLYPIFLRKMNDFVVLLKTVEEDLNKDKYHEISQKKLSPCCNIENLNNITIKDFFSIEEIYLNNLKDKKEIYIVGENGDGKTLLLQAIAIGLKGTLEDGLKEFRARKEKFSVEIENKNDIEDNFFAYGASRNNYCQMKEDSTGYLSLFSGEYDLKSSTKWLIDLYNAQNAKEQTIISLKNAIKLLQKLLNRDIEIEVTFNSVTFKEKGAIVSFDQLSAGYKGVITIISDLILRLSEKQKVTKIEDFRGVVLIDEVELHLHPKWQYSFMKKLRDTFPLIQFIVTTHSPTILLGASKDAIFYKVYKENGETKISNPIDSIKNFMANTLNTSPLFDMETARARNSDGNLDTREDYISAKIYNIIKERVKGKKAIVEEDIEEMINQELDSFLKEND